MRCALRTYSAGCQLSPESSPPSRHFAIGQRRRRRRTESAADRIAVGRRTASALRRRLALRRTDGRAGPGRYSERALQRLLYRPGRLRKSRSPFVRPDAGADAAVWRSSLPLSAAAKRAGVQIFFRPAGADQRTTGSRRIGRGEATSERVARVRRSLARCTSGLRLVCPSGGGEAASAREPNTPYYVLYAHNHARM